MLLENNKGNGEKMTKVFENKTFYITVDQPRDTYYCVYIVSKTKEKIGETETYHLHFPKYREHKCPCCGK